MCRITCLCTRAIINTGTSFILYLQLMSLFEDMMEKLDELQDSGTDLKSQLSQHVCNLLKITYCFLLNVYYVIMCSNVVCSFIL